MDTLNRIKIVFPGTELRNMAVATPGPYIRSYSSFCNRRGSNERYFLLLRPRVFCVGGSSSECSRYFQY